MKVNFELLDFQAFLNIDEDIAEAVKMAEEGEVVKDRLNYLINLKEGYEDNFLRFFHKLSTDPGFALEAYSKITAANDSTGEQITDINGDETYIATYDSSDIIDSNPDAPGQLWRYDIGNLVTVVDSNSLRHPFQEGDRIEIVSLEGGEHEYQYLAKFEGYGTEVYLVNDEELE